MIAVFTGMIIQGGLCEDAWIALTFYCKHQQLSGVAAKGDLTTKLHENCHNTLLTSLKNTWKIANPVRESLTQLSQ